MAKFMLHFEIAGERGKDFTNYLLNHHFEQVSNSVYERNGVDNPENYCYTISDAYLVRLEFLPIKKGEAPDLLYAIYLGENKNGNKTLVHKNLIKKPF